MTAIETDRLIIRNFRAEDGDDLCEMIQKYQASGYAQYDQPWPTEPEQVKGVAAFFAGGDDFLAVALKSTGKVIGFVALNPRDDGLAGDHNLGYVFNTDHHGAGYATEACRAALQRAFGDIGSGRLVTGTALENTPSCRLLARLGFEGKPQEPGVFILTRERWAAS